jgi:large subunit ribosomal protein L29
MKASEMIQQSTADLRKSVSEASEELFKLRVQKATGTLTKTHRFGELRKKVARLLTVLKAVEGKS